MEKNGALVGTVLMLGIIIVAVFLFWRIRLFNDRRHQIKYQVEWQEKNRPKAEDLFSSSESSDIEEKKRDDFEPPATVWNKWAIGATRGSYAAKEALAKVVVDDMDDTDSTDDSSEVHVHEAHVMMREGVDRRVKRIEKRRSDFEERHGIQRGDYSESLSSDTSSILPGMTDNSGRLDHKSGNVAHAITSDSSVSSD